MKLEIKLEWSSQVISKRPNHHIPEVIVYVIVDTLKTCQKLMTLRHYLLSYDIFLTMKAEFLV